MTTRLAAALLFIITGSWLLSLSVLARSSDSISTHDLSLYQYTDDGQVAQVAYAAQLVDRCEARVAFHDEQSDAVVMILLKKSDFPEILEPSTSISTQSIIVLEDSGLVFMLAGYAPDCDYVFDGINGAIQDHSLKYGESPDVRFLSSETSLRIVEGMYRYSGRSAVARPLAAAVLMASSRRGDSDGAGKVWQVDSSGSVTARRIALLGSMSDLQKRDIVDAISRREPFIDDDPRASLLSKCQQCIELLVGGAEAEQQYEVECCIIAPLLTHGHGQLDVIHAPPMTMTTMSSSSSSSSSVGELIHWLEGKLLGDEASTV